MRPIEFYNTRISTLKNELIQLIKKQKTLAWLRLAPVAGVIAACYFLLPIGLWFCIIPGVLLLLLFTRLVYADITNKSSIQHTRHLVEINENELKALSHNYRHFEDGAIYADTNHLYTGDLDIFGHASLYQYLNRTTSDMGSDTLASWLQHPSDTENLALRQNAIKELKEDPEWIQELQAYGASKRIKKETRQRLQQWFAERNRFAGNKYFLILRFIIPLIMVTILVLNAADMVNNYTRNYFILASTLFAFYISKKVSPLHQQVSKITDELDVFSENINLVEQKRFTSSYLKALQDPFIGKSRKASTEINKLKKILERLDLRFNFVVFIPLDILYQWDLQQVIALEKWKTENKDKVMQWFTSLGEMEALSSFAILSFNHPDWCFPEFKKEHFFIEAAGMGHPLIKANTCVTNPLQINEAGELMLITGSNMAGKSTYLRSVGVNTVLAMAGGPVYATSFYLSPVQVISSMRVADNLEENTSTFYAELKKLKLIINNVNEGHKIFILLDEILRGTNSLDRHTGSAALIKQLIKHKAACILATHDVELAKMKEDHPDQIMNYHFDVQVNNEELHFDYRLKEGICKSLNASLLMKKIGIEL